MGRVRGLVRRLNMDSLLRNNAESFACLHPVVGRGKELLSPDSYDSGNWRIARSPLQFAVEHGLLLDENGDVFAPEQALRHGLGHTDMPAYGHARLDEEKTLAVLRAQLGPVCGGFPSLAPERKALAAAFLAYANGAKAECVGILNDLSRSYTEKDGIPVCAALEQESFIKRLDAAWEKHKGITDEQLPARHTAFELTWLMALLTRARKKGVLASSQFLFVRPLDRPLWYALHQCGGRAAWAEGFAPWAHYMAEERAGKSLSDPQVAQAATALRDALAAQGWLADRPFSANTAVPNADPAPGNASPAHKPVMQENLDEDAGPDDDMVYAPADDDPEYDANEDPALRHEQF
jgi:hypothetical protein